MYVTSTFTSRRVQLLYYYSEVSSGLDSRIRVQEDGKSDARTHASFTRRFLYGR
jgi:hypothetical protein